MLAANFGPNAPQGTFRMTKKIAIIIGCTNYNLLRSEEGKELFADIPTAL